MIEPHTATKVAENISAKKLQGLVELNRSAIKNLKNDGVYEASQNEFNFHRFIAKKTGNPFIFLFFDFAENMLEDFKNFSCRTRIFYKEVLNFHERIFQPSSIGIHDGPRQECWPMWSRPEGIPQGARGCQYQTN